MVKNFFIFFCLIHLTRLAFQCRPRKNSRAGQFRFYCGFWTPLVVCNNNYFLKPLNNFAKNYFGNLHRFA